MVNMALSEERKYAFRGREKNGMAVQCTYLVVENAEAESLLALDEDDLLDERGPHCAAVEHLQRLGYPLRRRAEQRISADGGGRFRCF